VPPFPVSANEFGQRKQKLKQTSAQLKTVPKLTVWRNQTPELRANQPNPFPNLLSDIDTCVKNHEPAFSPMAKRNFALPLLRAIEAWIKAWKLAYNAEPVPAAMLALEAVARSESAVDTTAQKYVQAVCLGYVKKVAEFDPNLFIRAGIGPNYTYNKNVVQYSGAAQDTADVKARITQMSEAIDTAYLMYETKYAGPNKLDKTLKIFMGPEFFFRGINGAYDLEIISDILPELRKKTSDAKYKDWLFVFGTAIGATYVEETSCSMCKKPAKALTRTPDAKLKCPTCANGGNIVTRRVGAMIDNVALIQKGGEADDKNAHTIAKEYISHIDFRRALLGVTPVPGVPAATAGLKRGDWDKQIVFPAPPPGVIGAPAPPPLPPLPADRQVELKGQTVMALPPLGSRDVHGLGASKHSDERLGGAIFTIDGITFGMEICLDHINGRIDLAAAPQILLVPSAGAEIEYATLRCVADGFGFNVDGLEPCADLKVKNGLSAAIASTKSAVTSGGEIVMYDPVGIPA
jgi:hypothetical protein